MMAARSLSSAALAGALAVAALGCSDPGDGGGDDVTAGDSSATLPLGAPGTFFEVRTMRGRDTGLTVSRTNFDTTRCSDGEWRDRCEVTSIDLSLFGDDDAARSRFEAAFRSGAALVRGELVGDGAAATLVVHDGWLARGGRRGREPIVRLTSSTTCPSPSCPRVVRTSVNDAAAAAQPIHDLSWPEGVDAAEVAAALHASGESGVLAEGASRSYAGHRSFRVSAVWLRVASAGR